MGILHHTEKLYNHTGIIEFLSLNLNPGIGGSRIVFGVRGFLSKLIKLNKMKIAYIAHPISGDIKGNLEKIRQIVRQININEPDVVPFAPYWLDCHALDDDNPKERERGIKNDIALMNGGFIDEVRLYGDKISGGMRAEINLAEKLGISVVAMTKQTQEQL